MISGSTASPPPNGKPLRQSGGKNLLLRALDVVWHTIKGNLRGIRVIKQERGPRIAIAGLPDRSWIYHVSCLRLYLQPRGLFAFGRFIVRCKRLALSTLLQQKTTL